jgi:CRISPR/Cas system-associated endonuclease/helicase Cas3
MLYRALQQAMGHDGRKVELLLLHQYQFHRDRQPIETRVGEIFGPGSHANALLVATSGIKVGMDISADTLITDPAAPGKLLQRAGRCARFAGEQGRVIVAQVSQLPSSDTYPSPPPERRCRSAPPPRSSSPRSATRRRRRGCAKPAR